MKRKLAILLGTLALVLTASVLALLAGCASIPDVPYPLDGTTWVYVNKDDNNNQYMLSFTTENVTFTILDKDGAVYQEPIPGTYTLSGTNLTEVYDDYSIASQYNGARIRDSLDSRMVFTQQKQDI